MKASELRIGNWVISDSVSQVFGVSDNDTVMFSDTNGEEWPSRIVTECDIEQVTPIPLTPEWLERFGLKEKSIGGCEYSNNKIHLEVDEDGWYLFIQPTQKVRDLLRNHNLSAEELRDYVPCQYGIKYVHQLQNLYFALVGVELEIKQG